MSTPITSEKMLQAIIAAQVANKYPRWELLLGWPITDDAIYFRPSPDENLERYPIIEILLDTGACKALYGDGEQKKIMGVYDASEWLKISHYILEAWHSHDGYNVGAAIEMAYSFLPKG